MVTFDDNHFLFAMVVFFGMGQVIWSDGLFLHQIADILLVLEHLHNLTGGPLDVATVCAVASLLKLPGDDRRPFLLNAVFVEDEADKRRPFWLHCEFSVFDIVTQERLTGRPRPAPSGGSGPI